MRSQKIHQELLPNAPAAGKWLSLLTEQRDADIKEPIHHIQHFQVIPSGSSFYVVVLCNHLAGRLETWHQAGIPVTTVGQAQQHSYRG